MAKLDKDVEEEILAIVEKYQKENTKLLNYLITDDVITFFSPVANGSQITAEDLQKVADILKGSFEGMEIVYQEYIFKFKCGLKGVKTSIFFLIIFTNNFNTYCKQYNNYVNTENHCYFDIIDFDNRYSFNHSNTTQSPL